MTEIQNDAGVLGRFGRATRRHVLDFWVHVRLLSMPVVRKVNYYKGLSSCSGNATSSKGFLLRNRRYICANEPSP